MRPHPTTILALAASLWLGVPATAHGQTPAPTAPDYARANALASDGFEAFDRGRYAEAHDHFAQAEEAAHSPVFLLYMARCKRQLSEIEAARVLYDRVLAEELADDAPAPFRSAQDDAEAERGQLDTLLPVLVITLEGLTPADRVTLDGAAVALEPGASTITFRRKVEAGPHVLTVTRDGSVVAERQMELTVGQTVDTAIVLPTPAATPSPTPSPAPSPVPPPPPTVSTSPNFVPAYIVLGVAGAGAVLGAVMGGLALSQDKNAVDALESCDDEVTCADAEQARDQALTFAHVSTTSFVVASVAAATGVVLLLTATGGDEVSVGVGPGTLQLTASF